MFDLVWWALMSISISGAAYNLAMIVYTATKDLEDDHDNF